jgi:8-oxo-dGTP pyrophosphatase MutT (NUDIX family)
MIREAHEEIGIKTIENDLEKVGVMRFYFENTPQYNNETHVFMIHNLT